MKISESIKKRRSVREYQNLEVNRDVIESLVYSASLAPSGSNIQPWEFIVIDDPILINKISNFTPGISNIPPCLIVLSVDVNRAILKGGVFGRDQLAIMDISMAAENLMLSAVDNELGSCAIKSFSTVIIQRILDLPSHIVPELIICIGYPRIIPPMPQKRSVLEVIHYNGW